jgi:uncharacterized protein (DUF433 family)/soluble cytochrome b562
MYGLGIAAHYLGLPANTLKAWVCGRSYSGKFVPPIIVLPDRSQNFLSFTNLIEAHVLSAIRRVHQVSMPKIKNAIQFLSETRGSEHPLADMNLHTDGVDLFIEQIDKIINVSKDGQVAIKQVMRAYISRIERSEKGLVERLYPFTTSNQADLEEHRSIVIDPQVSFGRPVLVGTGIPVEVLSARFKAGESLQDLAFDYGCDSAQIESAIRYELAA